MKTLVDQCIESLKTQRDYINVAIEHLEAVQRLGGFMDSVAASGSGQPARRGRGPGKKQPQPQNGANGSSSNGKAEQIRVWCRECNPPKEFKNAHGLGLHQTRIHFAKTPRSLTTSTLAAG